MMTSTPISPDSTTPCPHCRATSLTGIHDGCYNCNRVKSTEDGKRPPRWTKAEPVEESE